MGFVARHGLRDAEAAAAAAEVLARAAREGVSLVRLAFPDQHGVLRGKAVTLPALPGAMEDGVSLTSTLLLKDTAHRTTVPVFSAGGGIGMRDVQGAADFVLVPDPATYRPLPWAPGTAWMLCDAYWPDGREVDFATRGLCRRVLGDLATAGYELVTGLEVEFHLTRLLDPKLAPEDAGQPGSPPEVALLTQGYQYLTEARLDQMQSILEVLQREVTALGLNLRSVEVEYGPSQVEFTFAPGVGLAPADAMVLFRSAVKQVARRHGHHASFMCRPRLPNVMSSGWHLHQSLRDAAGRNAFASTDGAPLSPLGLHWLGGLLAEAQAAAAFTTPTLNGYRRYRPMSLAPDRAVWGIDNRGVMLRVLGQPGSAVTHIENRVGEPAANPYLYLASQVVAGMAGLAARRDPGPSADAPYETAAPPLPTTLEAALAALETSAVFREGLGGDFVDYFLRLKRAEIARFNAEVSEWEQREYFDLF
ncbi:glutamine synthetase family protein [Paracraurococcus lichenis]|uniref:Glutamine synthetase family protein n=1 Tax=Paracraurococcus lichenis TaxID=3064888 RepID=A0ABT9E653_9PROT|nr:glutamine synthetase family protein [Paracraurococcus sp. LOR1-02]MDO9711616.1 glutamine synthetase family protein [Paracraurococcus sp. LOR1-02]